MDDFEYDAGYPTDVECVICLTPWRDPVELRPCSHIICRGCAESTAKVSTPCPTCRVPVAQWVPPNRIIVSIVSHLQGKCRKCKRWDGTVESYTSHRCPGPAPPPAPPSPPPQPQPPAVAAPIPAAAGTSPSTAKSPAAAPSAFHTQYDDFFTAAGPSPAAAPARRPTTTDSAPPTASTAAPAPRPDPSRGFPQSDSSAVWKQYGMTQLQYDAITAAFFTLSTDGSKLTYPRTLTLCRYLNLAPSDHEVKELFRMFHFEDAGDSGRAIKGTVNLEQICIWVQPIDSMALYGFTPEQYQTIRQMYAQLDASVLGFIDEDRAIQLLDIIKLRPRTQQKQLLDRVNEKFNVPEKATPPELQRGQYTLHQLLMVCRNTDDWIRLGSSGSGSFTASTAAAAGRGRSPSSGSTPPLTTKYVPRSSSPPLPPPPVAPPAAAAPVQAEMPSGPRSSPEAPKSGPPEANPKKDKECVVQ